ncbi:hypothetical protein BDV96DRAFT_652689 [Lophiotrema nucula]|uniref:Uncharacterized protein n=1 Tax=Lophiotrema nucula TaxID=690887 RepID=A0A6A5YMS9_9PLEO|nr:hypothetical protein BDV96DRAFT_652689 [Lophiotrema nucula]
MSHILFARNMSGHDQLFQVHGWNNNQDINIGPNSEATIEAPDGTSGAIIAVHDGCIGEQAEITKCGFGGNDFIDLSNICGAGGNLIVQQVGNDSTRKGDPRFMQNLRNAWQNASQETRDSLGQCVHCREDGTVARIDAPKDFPQLEEFVRTFADGKTYIGIGAWGGFAGNPSDNAQSSAGQGSTDILICYSDVDATPQAATSDVSVVNVSQEPQFAAFEMPQDSGPGIDLTNSSQRECEYVFYDNFWNGNGEAGANFDHPLKSIKLQPGESQFVDLPITFKDNDHAAHGDISLQQGCDGAATIASTDGSNRSNGFTEDVVSGAPDAAIRNKPNGERATDTTVGNWNGGPNQAAIDYLNQIVRQERAYILGGTGVPDVASSNNRLAVVMY